MKAVLVLDEMPENCGDCPCAYVSARCRVEWKKLSIDDVFDRRPEWCPLKEMPEPIPDQEDQEQWDWDKYHEIEKKRPKPDER